MIKFINNIKEFIAKETVFSIATLLAIISSFFVTPSTKYISYIDFRVLAILFCLMILVAGLKEQWIFRRLAEKLTEKITSARSLELVLILLCFFSSMVITNDVALITFVPFALALMNGTGLKHRIIRVITLETIAANLGSMLTPIGNPQNLYLYNLSGMSFISFIKLMLPLTIISFTLLIIVNTMCKNETLHVEFEKAPINIDKKKLSVIGVLFVICMGTVARLLPWQISFACVLITSILIFRNLLCEVDYYLLGTFVAFFVFIGNMQQITAVGNIIHKTISGRELIISTLLSQIISNVPTSMLLSGFTDNYRELLFGVNIGGLGTLMASLASLISYKFYAVTKGSNKLQYVITFTVWNLIFLAVLLIFTIFILS